MNTPATPAFAESQATRHVNWLSIVFVVGVPILIGPALWLYIQANGFVWTDFAIFAVLWALSGLAITAGYHRYYAHRTHQAAKPIQWIYALLGAMTVENSALVWASDHRYHHQHQDKDGDPYNINRGFAWAHIVWMFFKTQDERPFTNSPDLKKDPIVMWQHRNYGWLVAVMGFGVPTLIGACFGRPLAGLLWGGFLRMVIFHHTTFLVNSAAHVWGKKNYSDVNSARDNPLLAVLTFGEGYHSFHHAYPSDHRLGHRWFHFDPGKWWIRGLARVGLTWDLKTHPNVRRVSMRMSERATSQEAASVASVSAETA